MPITNGEQNAKNIIQFCEIVPTALVRVSLIGMVASDFDFQTLWGAFFSRDSVSLFFLPFNVFRRPAFGHSIDAAGAACTFDYSMHYYHRVPQNVRCCIIIHIYPWVWWCRQPMHLALCLKCCAGDDSTESERRRCNLFDNS